MEWNARLWRQSIERIKAFMIPLAAPLGRSERRTAATNYVQGLLMPGQRKSIEPMAARLGIEPQRLQQFMADSPWDETELWRVIRREVVPHFEPIEAWIVDETGWLKQGRNSVGVAHQYCGAVGKQANCQVSVELVVSDGFVAAPVGGRLYLPQSWIDDPQRCAKAGVPPDVGFATKNEIALTLIEQALADQVVPAPVLGDAAYGNGFVFRAHLRELNLEFFLQVTPEEHKGWIQEVPTTLKNREPSKALCLKLSRSRWHVEQYFQRSKDDLGLDHYEGRSWRGFHHHLVMSAIAYLFILTTYLAAKKNFWSDVGEDPGSDPAVATEIDRTLSLLQLDIPGEDR